MPQEPLLYNEKLEESLTKAASGNPQDLKKFFLAFLEGSLFVPDRNQLHIPLNSATYPSDFVRFLGIQDGERVIVPVFSRPEFAEEWANHPIATNQYLGSKLVELLPEEWWVCINPGQEIEKDLSPWEIKKLIDGEQNISEIIAEIIGDDTPSLLAIEAVTTMPDLTLLLSREAEKDPSISLVYLGRRQDLEALDSQEELILAVVINNNLPNERPSIKAKFENVAAPFLIGRGSLRVLVEESGQSLAIGSFKHINPLYSKHPESSASSFQSLISRFYATISSWLKKK